MEVSEVEGAADASLVSEALEIVWGILDDLFEELKDFDRSRYDDDLARLLSLARLVG